MKIKSVQTLVSEALKHIKTITSDDAHKMFNENQCNLIDIRDILLANLLGIGRAADLFLYLGLVTIFLFISYTVNRLDSTNKRISKLTKEIALNNVSKDQKNSKN